jgi:hypothetical protein
MTDSAGHFDIGVPETENRIVFPPIAADGAGNARFSTLLGYRPRQDQQNFLFLPNYCEDPPISGQGETCPVHNWIFIAAPVCDLPISLASPGETVTVNCHNFTATDASQLTAQVYWDDDRR